MPRCARRSEERKEFEMSKAMYYIGLILAIVSIAGGIVLGLVAGPMCFSIAVLGYILMVLLDFADKYLERNK